MSIREDIAASYKKAMIDKDSARVSTMRLVMAALKDRDIAGRTVAGKEGGVPDSDIMSMLQGMVKQRQDSIALYEQGGRAELADKERAEIAVISGFLPEMMGAAEVETAVVAAVASTGAASVKDMGKVMAELRAKYAGRMDMSAVGAIVKAKL
ncbi:aspartyl-tRNA amidotransferase subunit B [Alphaproteobacteria bacterium]|nr:aspartyl-tRNA amidotransferase subunit B [Alphaproteobacteria bacterium]